MVIFLLPETLRKKRHNEELQNDERKFEALHKIFSPMLSMVTDPTVILIAFYNSVVYASLYILASLILCIALHTY